MAISPRMRMLAGFLGANLAIACVAVYAVLQRAPAPPDIQGVLLQSASLLPEFELLDDQGRPFTREDLVGQWHVVAYGFTTCPDICPTLLTQVDAFVDTLADRGEEIPRVLFYSIDHRRDTPEQLASYLPFFNPEFVGLTHEDRAGNPHLPFERGLGMISRLDPPGEGDQDAGGNDYQVSHGVHLFLLDPEGALQAVFKPHSITAGQPAFDADALVSDYLAVLAYVNSTEPGLEIANK